MNNELPGEANATYREHLLELEQLVLVRRGGGRRRRWAAGWRQWAAGGGGGQRVAAASEAAATGAAAACARQVRALNDSTVVPNESELFGACARRNGPGRPLWPAAGG